MLKYSLLLFIIATFSFMPCKAMDGIQYDRSAKTVTITVPSRQLSIVIDYSRGCMIRALYVKGRNTLSSSGVYTGIRTQNGTFSSAGDISNISVSENTGGVTLSGIRYGNAAIGVEESWHFKVSGEKIVWDLARTYNATATLEDMFLPAWNFADLDVWKGGMMDNGGMVWCKYLQQVNDTYGVHTGGITFWNVTSGDALRITPQPVKGKQLATKYTHSERNEFTCTHLMTDQQLAQRYNLSRFVAGKADVFAPFEVQKGTVHLRFELQYVDYNKTYSRGTLPGIDATAVRELMNTTARYGVVDNNIVGGNGWLTNWKCLHEPFFAQIGMALNDADYTRNMSATLDQERDLAMLPDGRVLSRWHNAPGDEIPGTYNAQTGYYEAMWGYTIDSQTGYVINTAEQFSLNGDTAWLRSHQRSCEKALDWLIKRDSNNNGIFEMMNDNISQQKASDWLDIVWASFENAFVNAQLYEALQQWSACEQILGDKGKSAYYASIAGRLKTAFNKPVSEGGFWSPEKAQYVYWRDKDGTVHGDNLVTPVNFAAIAFGLCDDKERIAMILDETEQRAKQENLFHWPLCFDSFQRPEVSNGNWPFPKYENGDIFPTWGYLGVRAYATYDKAIALKYIHNMLAQYNKDGLSSQRYSRVTQQGLGDDILAGICTSITALYRDIYGIRPEWNRMGLMPNMSEELNGTKFSYTLRDTAYTLELSVNDYLMRTGSFSIKSREAFGASRKDNVLRYYHQNKNNVALEIKGPPVDMEIHSWNKDALSWSVTSRGSYTFTAKGLQPGASYQLLINNRSEKIRPKADGSFSLSYHVATGTKFMLRQ